MRASALLSAVRPGPILAAGVLLVSFCAGRISAAAEPAPLPVPPVGTWYALLRPVEGLEVRFGLKVEAAGAGLKASLLNGSESMPFTSASWDGQLLALDLDHLDARLTAGATAGGLSGRWTRVVPSGKAEAPFDATRNAPPVPEPARGAPSIAGEWGVEVGEGATTGKLLGIFRQKGGEVAGTFLDPSGDAGPYHGTWDGKSLVLQIFDGVHVARVDATLGTDGRLVGTRRDRTGASSRFAARRLAASEEATWLPDSFGVTRPKDRTVPFAFSLPDADGKVVSSTDPRFAGKPMLVVFSGTWCPNCNDEAPVLAELHARYQKQGLEVVTLFFEYTADAERSRRQVKRFAGRYGLSWPLLVAGTTKDARTTPVMQQVEGFAGYPTTLFLDRSHRVVKIHAGFDGPSTGKRYDRLKKELDASVRALFE